MKRILVILGHPSKESLCKSIVEKYIESVKESGAEVKKLFLSDLKFDPILHEGYKEEQKLEKDLEKSQELIKWAEHVVFVYPVWWGGLPALMKGWLDRVFLPGFAFKYCMKEIYPSLRFLKGKTARLIITTGGPRWIYWLTMNPSSIIMKNYVLRFTGVYRIKKTAFHKANRISEKRAERIFEKVRKVAKRDSR